MPVLKTLNVKIPENLQRHILPHRDDNPAPPKIPSSEKGLALTLEGLEEQNSTGYPTSLPLSEQEIRRMGEAALTLNISNKAVKGWLALSLREVGLPQTLATVLGQAHHNQGGSWVRSATDTSVIELRGHLAAADQAEYQACRELASRYLDQGTHVVSRVCFLFPGENGWFEQTLKQATYQDRPWLAASVDSLEQAKLLTPNVAINHFWTVWHPNLLFNLIHRIGVEAAPLIANMVERLYSDSEASQKASQALACLPHPDAFRAIYKIAQDYKAANEYLLVFIENFPALALPELLKAGAPNSLILPLISRNPELVKDLPRECQEQGQKLLEQLRSVPDAASKEELPDILTAPRWLNRKSFQPARLSLTPVHSEPSMDWPEGWEERWRSKKPARSEQLDFKAFLSLLPAWERNPVHIFRHLETCPDSLGPSLIEAFTPSDPWYMHQHIKGVVARWQLAALPLIRKQAEAYLSDTLAYFRPFRDGQLCLRAAEAYCRLKSKRKEALEYLLAHPKTAAQALIPELFGKTKKNQKWAQQSLLALSQQGFRQSIEEAASAYGPEAKEALTALLEMDELDILPDKMPELPSWYHSASLEPPILKAGGAVTGEALDNLTLMLAISKPGEPYPGLDQVKEAATEDSLCRFAWSLYQLWQDAGADSKDYWAFHSLGFLGNDEVVRKLTPLLKKWPGEGAHARAVQGLDILTAIGTDIALMHLFGLSQKLKFKGLKAQASERIQEIAQARNITAHQLADRLVPDLDLDQKGSLKLDYGQRSFTVGFDESLKPFVKDEDGKLKKSLPKPGKTDDSDLAPQAFDRFKALKKDVKAIASQQLTRLEQAMVKERQWSPHDFRVYFVEHPLIVHLTRRLVWSAYDSNDHLLAHFRVTEDGTLADVEDEVYHLDPKGSVRLAHPLTLGPEALSAWSEVFADYEILQPFPQLGRETYQPEKGETQRYELKRFEGKTIASLRLLGLESKGWRRGEAQDGGVFHWMIKELSPERFLYLNFQDGIIVGEPAYIPQQTLTTLTLHSDDSGWGDQSELPFSELSATAFSEIIRDLAPLVDENTNP